MTGLGGGHRLSRHTMVMFVAGGEAGKWYMMSGQCWLATGHIQYLRLEVPPLEHLGHLRLQEVAGQ